jgi:hypothetical protein
MGRATDLDNFLSKLPPAEDGEGLDGPRPELRLGAEALKQALGPDAPIRDVLDRQAAETGEKRTVLRDPKTGITSVAVPLEQYLELVTSHIRDRNIAQLTLDNRVIPSDDVLSEFGVEQVDPQATWLHMGEAIG